MTIKEKQFQNYINLIKHFAFLEMTTGTFPGPNEIASLGLSPGIVDDDVGFILADLVPLYEDWYINNQPVYERAKKHAYIWLYEHLPNRRVPENTIKLFGPPQSNNLFKGALSQQIHDEKIYYLRNVKLYNLTRMLNWLDADTTTKNKSRLSNIKPKL